MAGRMLNLLRLLQRLVEKVDALGEELAEMQAKYSRMKKGTWQERVEEASRGLAYAKNYIEELAEMAEDLAPKADGGEDDEPDGDATEEATEEVTEEVADDEGDDEGDEGDPLPESFNHTPGGLSEGYP